MEAGTADEDTAFSVDLVRKHDVFFTLGENVGQPDCLVPACGIRWLPTRQPIVLRDWPAPQADSALRLFRALRDGRVEEAGRFYDRLTVAQSRAVHEALDELARASQA